MRGNLVYIDKFARVIIASDTGETSCLLTPLISRLESLDSDVAAHLVQLGALCEPLHHVPIAPPEELVGRDETGARRGEGADLGQVEKAIEHIEQARDIFRQIKSPAAEQAERLLAELLARRDQK